MSYVIPSVQIQQELTQAAVFQDQPLAAFIIGPQYELVRYLEEKSKAAPSQVVSSEGVVSSAPKGNLYVNSVDTTYAWPYKTAGTVVDLDWTKVYMENLEGKYFPNTDIGTASNAATIAGKVLTTTINLKTDTNARNACFSNRDVQPGDKVIVTAVSGGATLTTSVKSVDRTFTAAANTSITHTEVDANGDSITGAEGISDLEYDNARTALTNTQVVHYYLTCTRAGSTSAETEAGKPKYRVTSDVGTTSFEFIASSTPGYQAIGHGLTISTPSGTAALGDKWTFLLPAPTSNGYKTLTLNDSWAAVSGSTSVTFELFITKTSYEITEMQYPAYQDPNWVASTAGIQINKDLFITDPGLLTSDGYMAQLPIRNLTARLYIQYRAQVFTNTTAINSTRYASDVASLLGPVTPDNPLAQGVYHAALNAAGTPVYYLAVSSNDEAGYNTALSISKKSSLVYGMVPLTYDVHVQTAFANHVEAMSEPAEAKWRVAWFATPVRSTLSLLTTKANGDNYLASVVADVYAATNAVYNKVTIPGVDLVALGVRVGDIVRCNYTTNVYGELVWDDFVITEVRSANVVIIDPGLGYEMATTSLKVEIYRQLTSAEKTATYIADSGRDNRRVREVFPSQATLGTTVYEGYYVAAACAGLRASVVPHQGLTNTEVQGFDGLDMVVNQFTYDQLNEIAAAGTWIVTQDALGSTPYVRHQLTSANLDSGLNFREDSITTNTDSISRGLQVALEPYIGKYNVNPANVKIVRNVINGQLTYRTSSATSTVRAGAQLNGFEIVSCAQDPTFKDRIAAEVTLDEPAPMNNVTVKLIV